VRGGSSGPVYQKKTFKEESDFAQVKPIRLGTPSRLEEQHPPSLEIIHEDPNAVDESAIIQQSDPLQL